MMEKIFISVILPLKLEWEPCYYSIEEVKTGDRVSVAFAGKTYTGVVSRTDIVPDIDREKIKPVISEKEDWRESLSRNSIFGEK